MGDDLSDWIAALAREQAKTIDELRTLRDERGHAKYGAIEDLEFERPSVIIMESPGGTYQFMGFSQDAQWFKDQGMIGIYDVHESRFSDMMIYQGKPFKRAKMTEGKGLFSLNRW